MQFDTEITAAGLKMVNVLGCTVLEQALPGNVKTVSVSLSRFPDGIYFLYVVRDRKMESINRVVVQH